jgi:hypothetical protein
MLGHSIVSQHFMEPVGSIPNSQDLPTYSYPEPDQSSPYHPVHFGWGPCPHSMLHPRVVDGGTASSYGG